MELTCLELREICIERNWFTKGTNYQYERLFLANDIKASVTVLASIIWACSETDLIVADIVDILLEENKKRHFQEHDFYYKEEYGHYALYVDGVFYCTCDTLREVNEEMAEFYK